MLFEDKRRNGAGSSFPAALAVGGLLGPNDPARPRGVRGVGGLPAMIEDFRVSWPGSFPHAELSAFSSPCCAESLRLVIGDPAGTFRAA